uniref:Uncharacterized protein n=1 Tax=Vespula pensylvanica TaxID=30213 RepID=A0A834NX26_VESPE|nr:hypothetical protein H0235_010448 [Vespula pensylvanica]
MFLVWNSSFGTCLRTPPTGMLTKAKDVDEEDNYDDDDDDDDDDDVDDEDSLTASSGVAITGRLLFGSESRPRSERNGHQCSEASLFSSPSPPGLINHEKDKDVVDVGDRVVSTEGNAYVGSPSGICETNGCYLCTR